jgi:hypothetical protein
MQEVAPVFEESAACPVVVDCTASVKYITIVLELKVCGTVPMLVVCRYGAVSSFCVVTCVEKAV